MNCSTKKKHLLCKPMAPISFLDLIWKICSMMFELCDSVLILCFQCQENFMPTAEEKLSCLIKSEGLSYITSPAQRAGTPASARDRRPDTKAKAPVHGLWVHCRTVFHLIYDLFWQSRWRFSSQSETLDPAPPLAGILLPRTLLQRRIRAVWRGGEPWTTCHVSRRRPVCRSWTQPPPPV